MATGGVDVDELQPMMGVTSLFEPDDIATDDFEGDIDGMDLNNEMKVDLINPTEADCEVLLEQLRERLNENHSECIYTIGTGEGMSRGLSAAELDASMVNLKHLAEKLNAECVELRKRQEQHGCIADLLVRVRADERDFTEVRVAVVGNVDAGKSTLLGVLTHAELDNGRGYARQKLFRHKHEMESGRTSSVGNDILGFDSCGGIVNRPDHGSLDWVKICEKASKVVTFIDLAGHEKYLKTTVFGMTGHAPDFSMLMVGANAGVVGMAKEHLGLALALGVPVFVVVTKIDMCPPNILQETLQMLHKILKSPGCRKMPVLVQTMDDVVVSAMNFTSERMCPIFQVSNVTGENLALLRTFLNLLSTRMPCNYTAPAEFQIDETFAVPGVGTVVSGTTLRGHIKLGDTLLLGPDSTGQFQPIVIKSIHRKRMAVREVKAGQTASFALKKFKRSQLRKGMVMVHPVIEPKACWEFEGDILILHHPTTISVKYQAMVHVGSVRQTATIVSMSKDHLRTGDKAVVRFKFIKNPEYLRPDIRLVFREGRTKAVGTVTHIIPYTGVSAGGSRQPRGNVSTAGGKREAGQGSGLGAVGGSQHTPLRVQNEPQKPSKRNRRGRGHKNDAAAAMAGASGGGAVGGAKSTATANLVKSGNPVVDTVSSADLLKRKETVPET